MACYVIHVNLISIGTLEFKLYKDKTKASTNHLLPRHCSNDWDEDKNEIKWKPSQPQHATHAYLIGKNEAYTDFGEPN